MTTMPTIHPETAEAIKSAVRLGQRGLYIPAPGKEERNAAVRREFDGTNGAEVMRRHGIKRSTLYAIVGQRSRNGIGGTGPAVQAAP